MDGAEISTGQNVRSTGPMEISMNILHRTGARAVRSLAAAVGSGETAVRAKEIFPGGKEFFPPAKLFSLASCQTSGASGDFSRRSRHISKPVPQILKGRKCGGDATAQARRRILF